MVAKARVLQPEILRCKISNPFATESQFANFITALQLQNFATAFAITKFAATFSLQLQVLKKIWFSIASKTDLDPPPKSTNWFSLASI